MKVRGKERKAREAKSERRRCGKRERLKESGKREKRRRE